MTDKAQYRGWFIDPEDGKVHIYLLKLRYKLEEGFVENEGDGIYLPIDYHKTDSESFAKIDIEILDKLYFTKDKLELDFS